MKLLFTEPASGKNEVQNTNFLDYYPSISASTSWTSLRPYINQAARKYIIKYIGKPFYDELCNYAEATTDDPVKDEILEQLRIALAHYSIHTAMPHLNIIISDSGTNQNRNEKTGPASQWAFKSARWSSLYGAECALDQALTFMYLNKSNEFLNTWTESEAFKFVFTDFISGVNELKNYINVTSIRGYLSLVPFIKKAESEVKNILGPRTYDIIKNDLSSGDENKIELIKKIRYFISERALYLAIPHLALYIDGGTIVFMSSVDGIEPGYGVWNSSNEESISRLTDRSAENSKLYQQDIRTFLAIKKDVFVEWAEDIYQEYRSKSVFTTTNCNGDAVGGIML